MKNLKYSLFISARSDRERSPYGFRQTQDDQAQGFAANAKGDEKKEFENKHSDKAFRCEQEKKTADLSRAHTCRM